MVCKHIIAGQHQDVNSTSMNFSILWKLDKSTKQLVLFMYCSNLKYLTFHDQLLPACSLHLQFTTCSEVMLYAFALKVDVNPTGTTSAVPLGHAEIALSFLPSFPLSHFSWISRCKDSQERLQHHPRHWSQHHRWLRDLKRSSGDVATLHHGILWWT